MPPLYLWLDIKQSKNLLHQTIAFRHRQEAIQIATGKVKIVKLEPAQFCHWQTVVIQGIRKV